MMQGDISISVLRVIKYGAVVYIMWIWLGKKKSIGYKPVHSRDRTGQTERKGPWEPFGWFVHGGYTWYVAHADGLLYTHSTGQKQDTMIKRDSLRDRCFLTGKQGKKARTARNQNKQGTGTFRMGGIKEKSKAYILCREEEDGSNSPQSQTNRHCVEGAITRQLFT